MVAPGLPIDTVATGTPGGICTVDSSASSPFSADESIGTPMTGSDRVRRDDAAEMRRGAGADDEDLDAAAGRLADQPHDALGRAVRGRHRHLARDPELAQHVDGALHHRRVGIRAHQNQNRHENLRCISSDSDAFAADVAAVLHAVE